MTQKQKIVKNMISVLNENKRTSVWYGDIELIEQCALLSGLLNQHPQKMITTVLNALEGSPYFSKGFITADFNGSNRKYRCFTLNIIP